MTATPERPAARRRGRRPGGSDTRTALLTAARAMFTEQGYDGATVRMIASRAGVDPAMVNHWFGSKEGLFAEAVLELPINPELIVTLIMDGDVEHTGERIVRTFLNTWDATGGGVFAALMRSVTAHQQATHVLRDLFLKRVFGRLLENHFTRSDNQQLRATLVASQTIGLGVIRYVVAFDPLASTDVETLVHAVGPTIQRYLTGPL